MDNFDLFEHIDFLDEQACEISIAEPSFAQPQATIYRGDKWDQLRETDGHLLPKRLGNSEYP